MSDAPEKQETPDAQLASGASAEDGSEPHFVSGDNVPADSPNDNSGELIAFVRRTGAKLVCTFKPVKHGARTEREITGMVRALPDQDFYVFLGETHGAPRTTPDKSDVSGSRWAWTDIDPPKPAPDDFDLEAWREATLARLRSVSPNPTLIMDSGRGFWPLYELAAVATPQELEAINLGLNELLGGDDADHCWNCNRVMRAPGTRNSKTGRMAVVLEDSGAVYSLSDLPRGKPKAKSDFNAEIGAAERLEDVAALRGKLPDRALVAIVRGKDEENPLKGDNTRSAWLYHVLCELARANVRPEVALGIITDPDFGISESVLEKSDVEKYALRNVANAYGEIAQKRAEQQPSSGEAASLVSIAPIDADALPERPWLVEGLLLRGAVSISAARGGAGKSLHSLQIGIMCAAGVEWAYWKPRHAVNVAVLNAEDDTDELRRRTLSACEVMGVDQSSLAGKLTMLRGSGFTLFVRNDEGKIAETPFYQDLIKLCRSHDIGLLIVDPLVETHANLDENSNTDMKEVIVGLRSLARRLQIPILVLHHSRKGQQAGDQDTARGGSAIINAARIAFTLDPMSEDEAKLLPEGKRGERWRYVRYNGAKANYSGRAGDKWLKIESVQLANGDSSPGMCAVDLSEAGAIDREKLTELLRDVIAAADVRKWWRPPGKTPRDGRLDAEIERRFGMSAPQAKALTQRLVDEGYVRVTPMRDTRNARDTEVVVFGRWPDVPITGDEPF